LRKILMRTTCLLAAALAIGLTMGAAAQAAVLTFEGDICDVGGGVAGACGNGAPVLASYGDIAGQLDVKYDADLANVGADDRIRHWPADYSGMTHVGFGFSGATVEVYLQPLSGYQVTLVGFDLGGWENADRETQITLLGGNGAAISSTGPITVSGTAPLHTAVNLTRPDGFRIRFGPDAYNVGIDNIEFTVSAVDGTIVPEPSTWALMILGFGGVGAAMRTRRRPAAA
jgi:hypothetical protein